MKPSPRKLVSWIAASAAAIGATAVPLLAQGDMTQAAESPSGTVMHWLNFLLIAGALVYVMRKYGRRYFRVRAQSIRDRIHEAAAARAAAERERKEAEERMAALDLEIQDMRRAAVRETAAEAERIRGLAGNEAKRIAEAARMEIEAARRAAQQELRAAAARLATERAAALLRELMGAGTEAALFRSFVEQLERSAS